MITVILRDGSETTLAEWQKIYGLPVGSDNIGRHYTLHDSKIAENLRDNKFLVINELLIRVADLEREKNAEPSILNAFNRSHAKQISLQNELNPDGSHKYEAAKYSPHEVFMAIDKSCSKFDTIEKNGVKSKVFNLQKTKEEVAQTVKFLKEAAKELGIKIRIGWKLYQNQSIPMYFVHYDVCAMYYGKGMPFNSRPHPWEWEVEAEW